MCLLNRCSVSESLFSLENSQQQQLERERDTRRPCLARSSVWQLQLPQQLRQRSLGWLPVNCGCLAHDSCQLLPTPVKLPSAAAITHRQPTDSKHFVPQYIAFDGRIGIDRMAADISCLKSQSISLECTVRNVKRGKMLPSANMCLAII